MRHLDNDGLAAQFRRSSRAFHLEVRDDYTATSAEEAEGLQQFLRGETENDEWAQPRFDLMRELTGNGVSVQRVRVVTEPHNDYTRYSLATTGPNIDAGEDIRWLPRHRAGELADDDWWLFDDTTVAYTVFTDTATLPGWVATTDPLIARHCVSVRDRLWRMAVAHRDYVTIL